MSPEPTTTDRNNAQPTESDTHMNTNQISNTTTRRSRRLTKAAAGTAVVIAGFIATSCTGSVDHNYRTFHSALDRGASCKELFDQRARFHDEGTLAKIDSDLVRIGCTSPDSTRTDG